MSASSTDLGRAFDEKPAGLDRRQLLKVGAWAAPVLILATATPAAASSTPPTNTYGATIPTKLLGILTYGMTNTNANGLMRGPIDWSGGQIVNKGIWSDPAGIVGYTVVATGPGGFRQTLVEANSATIAPYGNAPLTGRVFGTAPMAQGTYTVITTATGSDGSITSLQTITL